MSPRGLGRRPEGYLPKHVALSFVEITQKHVHVHSISLPLFRRPRMHLRQNKPEPEKKGRRPKRVASFSL